MFLVPLLLIISYTYLISTFLSPNNPLRNAFIHHYTVESRCSATYIAGFYGISLLMGMFLLISNYLKLILGSFISRYLRDYNKLSRFQIAFSMLTGHIFIFVIILWQFQGVSFEAMIMEKEK